MFIVEITYTHPKEAVEAHRQGHKDFVAQGFADGVFITAGPKASKNGGFLLADFADLAACETYMALDPFNAVADIKINEVKLVKDIRAA